MSEQAMRDAIQSILQLIGANPSLQNSLVNRGYIYSAYISTLVIEALREQASVTVTIRNPPNGPFRFPMAPSEIYTQNGSWYEICTPKGVWEMHLCCRCDGVSALAHELDVVIMSSRVAQRCRTTRRRPQEVEVVLLIECKNVGALDYAVGREFLGLCSEFPCYDQATGQPQWRGDQRLGALVATLPSLPQMPSALQLVQNRKLVAGCYVEPLNSTKVTKFQQDVIDVLRPTMFS